MARILVDFSKLPEEVLEEYGIETYNSYEDIFEDVFMSDDAFSVRDAVELLKNDTMQDVVEAQPYVYKFNDKYYRWTEDELMYELVKKYPDAIAAETARVDLSTAGGNYWAEIRNDYWETNIDPKEGDILARVSIDAWRTPDDNEEGAVIASVLLSTHGDVLVDYRDAIARTDEMAQEAIEDAKTQLKEYLSALGFNTQDKYVSPLDQFIENEVPFRIEDLNGLPLTNRIKDDLIQFVQNRSDIMFDYDAFDERLLNKYDELVHESCQTYVGVIDYLCASLNKEENDEYNRKTEEFSPMFETTHYFGIYSYNGDNEYYLISKEGEYDLVLDDSFEGIGKNNLTLLEGEEILDIANRELLANLAEYSRENIKGLIPERELVGLHVLELALNPNDVNLIFESVKRQLESEENCTGYGEPQAFVTLENGRSIEVTLEKEMLPETDYFYSARLHCTEEEFDNKDYNSTVGIINCVTSASANVDEIMDLLIATLKCNEQYPIENHSKKPSLDSVIDNAQERRGAPISSEHFYAIDSKNYVEKVTHPTDHHEDYYKFYFNGEFAGGLANKHVIGIVRTGKPDVELVDQAIIKQFNDMHRERNLFLNKNAPEPER